MALEDTIRNRLFQQFARNLDSIPNQNNRFVIECKAEYGKPVPLCMPRDVFNSSHLVYRKLHQSGNHYPAYEERSSPRAMYNLIFGSLFWTPLITLRIKGFIYYTAHGVLFNADKELLFYFAREYNSAFTAFTPRLYITPTLLADASQSSKPMEKFFMSTVVPFLVDNEVNVINGFKHTIIEIDNHADDKFFQPSSNLVSTIPVDQIHSRLNNILADNADVLSSFIHNYKRR